MRTSHSITTIAPRLAKALSALKNPAFDSKNPHFQSKYASLAGVRNAIVGRNCHVGRNVTLDHGAVLGDKTTLTDFTRA